MNLREFQKAGHWPTLLSAFLYFDVSFMIWVLIGSLAASMAQDFHLTDGEKSLMVAIPILGGAVLRLVLGSLVDALGGRRTALIGMALTFVPLVMGWLWADTFPSILLMGLFLGVAGASFAVALPLASRWYPPQYQGLALGIAGAGNSGTALATFFAPRIAALYSWHAAFGIALVPLSLTFVFFYVFAKDSPSQQTGGWAKYLENWKNYRASLRHRDTWWFCFFYSVTFGGFVGLASFLGLFFKEQYGLTAVQAGTMTTLCVLAGSFFRPIGGMLADRLGGIYLLKLLYFAAGMLLLDLATLPPIVWGSTVIVVLMGLLGMGNGAIFQLVPLRFPKEVGGVTGLVGAAGGIGGFLLPMLLGSSKQWVGSFGPGLLMLASIAVVACISLINVSQAWEGDFVGEGGKAAGNELATS